MTVTTPPVPLPLLATPAPAGQLPAASGAGSAVAPVFSTAALTVISTADCELSGC